MTLIDTLDTAVKIGLGALISAVASHLLARSSHVREMTRLAYVRRQDAIQSAAGKAETHFNAWRDFVSGLAGIQARHSNPADGMSDVEWKFIRGCDEKLIATAQALSEARSVLLLLGARDAILPSIAFAKVIGDFRDRVMLHKHVPTKQELTDVKYQASQSIDTFYIELSKVYLSLPS